MGIVLAAYDEELDRKVAIKLLHPHQENNPSFGRTMLLREAQAMARLSHPNVVAVHEVGVVEDAVFMAMEHVAGLDLQQWLGERSRPWREIVAVFREAGKGLLAAHREGLIHRDFKPSNVLVGDDGRVRVADFGLATRGQLGIVVGIDGEVAVAGSQEATPGNGGGLVGTPLYMAPELYRGETGTAASDQYAFCVALYEALYDELPFAGESMEALRESILKGELPARPRTSVPEWLHAVLVRGLAQVPGDRFASLADLLDLLAQDPEAQRALRRRRAAQIVAVVVGTAVLVVLMVLLYGFVTDYLRERRADARLRSLSTQVTALREAGEADEAERLLAVFVALPENRGLAVVARAYLQWAAAETDDAAAIDAYASAYISAREQADELAALRGLISRLSSQGSRKAAAAALDVLTQMAPNEAASPEFRRVRLAAALSRRDLAGAAEVLGDGDLDTNYWKPVLKDLSNTTPVQAPEFHFYRRYWEGSSVLDIDGDGRDEVLAWSKDRGLSIFNAEPELRRQRSIDLDAPESVEPILPVIPGEPLVLATYGTDIPEVFEIRLLTFAQDGALRVLDSWQGSRLVHAVTVDLDGDDRREIYVATEAYERRLWRLDRSPAGIWSRHSPHAPTDVVHSDLGSIITADLEDDGKPELVIAAGAWRAYDLRVFKPLAERHLDLVARRAFGSFGTLKVLRRRGPDLLAFTKRNLQISADRFPADRPMGEPEGLYIAALQGRTIEVKSHIKPPPELLKPFERIHTGDLDGDGDDELVIDVVEEGMILARWRANEPVRPLLIAGVRPIWVADIDGDGKAEIMAMRMDDRQSALLLGVGESTLPPLPREDLEPREVPLEIEDPAIASAWQHAEQLVAIGVPRRTADELSAIGRLSGELAPDMFLRTAEIYAGIGEDTLAVEHYLSAATRPDLASVALGGAAAARLRLGELDAAQALTRERLALVDPDQRSAVEAELAALTAATATRPEVMLTFERPLDRRWSIDDPVALKRALGEQALSVWSAGSSPVASLSMVWDGGPVALEVELRVDNLAWGSEVEVRVVDGRGDVWLSTRAGVYGSSTAPDKIHVGATDGNRNPGLDVQEGQTIRARVFVYPSLELTIDEIEAAGQKARRVRPSSAMPPAGPLRLEIVANTVAQRFVGHVWIQSIRASGFSLAEAEPTSTVDPAWLLAEGQFEAAIEALGSVRVGSREDLWRIDALLSAGAIEAATEAMAAFIDEASLDRHLYKLLYQRVRRDDEVAWVVAVAAFGPRLLELIAAEGRSIRPQEVLWVLRDLKPSDWSSPTDDPTERERRGRNDYIRGLALMHAGRYEAAKSVFSELQDRLSASLQGEGRGLSKVAILQQEVQLAVHVGDQEAAVAGIREILGLTETPYIELDIMLANANLAAFIEEHTWQILRSELEASRP